MNELIQLASDICETPISLVSLLTVDQQLVLSSAGTDMTCTPREAAFCAHTVEAGELFVVEDAALDERFRRNPLVTGEPHIRFYAGIPLRWPDGESRGALCVIDKVPRRLSSRQENALRTLAHQVERRFGLQEQKERLERSLKENEDLTAKLQQSYRMFLAFMSHAPFLCYIKDAAGRFAFYNKFCAAQFGVSEEAWLGKSDRDLFSSDLADEYRRNDLEAMTGSGAVETFERTQVDSDRFLHWKSYKFPIRASTGETMLAGISIDYTEHLERERKLLGALDENMSLSKNLEANKNLLQGFLDHAPYFTYIKTTAGEFTTYNRMFAEHYGITATEWIGRSMHDLFPEAEAADYAAHDAELLRRREPVTAVYRTVGSLGEKRTFKATKFLLQGAEGEDLIGGVSHEISAEAALEEQRERLAALGTMASGMAHEINNPLAIIHMAAGDLLEELGREQPELKTLMHCAEDVMQTTLRIKKIVQSMRTMSRDGSKDKPAMCTAKTIVEETVQLCRERFKNSAVQLEMAEVDPALLIMGQQTQLEQVLLNLAVNAYDAAYDGEGAGWVRIGAGVRDGRVRFYVTDSGAGVAEELKGRIMEPFFTTKEIGKGTGLGLSISRTIIAEHGGTLELSEEGGHTCFSFRIPRVDEGVTLCN